MQFLGINFSSSVKPFQIVKKATKKFFQSGRGKETGLGRKILRLFWEDRSTFKASGEFFKRYNISSRHGWSMEHMIIKQRWYRGRQPIFPPGTKGNKVFQGLGDAGWNVVPIPHWLNQKLYHHKLLSFFFNVTPYAATGYGIYEFLDED